MGAVFLDRAAAPAEEAVERVLGPAASLWRDARRQIAAEHAPVREEWTWSGKTGGWSLRLKQRDRAIVYLTPWEGECRVGFAIGEKAVAAAQREGAEPTILGLLESAPRYAEGRGVRFVLHAPADLDTLSTLARIKMAS